MKTSALVAIVAALLLAPARSEAQQVNLQITNGLVTLDAQNVSIRQILAEWARVGGAKIVNGEKVMGAAVTLQLNGVPERQAIDTILRGVSGYMLASRNVGSTGVSAFDRILILPTSAAAPRAGVAPPVQGYPGPRAMPVQADPADSEVIEDEDNDEPEPDNDGSDEVVQQPPPGVNMNPRFQRRFPNPMGVQGQPFMPQQNFPGVVAPNQGEGQPQPGAVTATPANPFGIPAGASSTPGVVTPVPQQDQQQQPTVRPPRPPAEQ